MAFGFGARLPNAMGAISGSPSLSLVFAGASSLDPRITFTRNSTATYFNASGVLSSASANTPRFDYDPVTRLARGLLIEEQRTNLLTYSEQFGNAAWTAVRASVSSNTVVSPDGTQDAETITQTTGQTTSGGVYQAITVALQPYSVSAYFKKGTKNFGVIRVSDGATPYAAWFNLNTGVVGTKESGITSSAMQNVGNGWYRCSIVYTPALTSVQHQFYHADTDASLTVTDSGTTHLWGAQLESGAFATSYIPTTTAQVTRIADSATMTGTNFSSWYNATEGTLFAEGASQAVLTGVAPAVICEVDDNTTSNEIAIQRRIASYLPTLSTISGGATQTDLFVGTAWAIGASGKVASCYKTDDFAISFNGGAAAVDTSGAVPTVDRLRIGARSNGARVWNGWVSRISYFPRRLTNSELQAITS